MAISSRTTISQFKSSRYDTARHLLRSRNTQVKRAGRRTKQVHRLRRIVKQLGRDQLHTEQQLQQAKLQIQKLQIENAQLRKEPVRLPDDPPLPDHCYGAKMIMVQR